MRPFFTSLMLLICIAVDAQNLVPNPSFEEYLECPFSVAGLDNQVVDWFTWQQSPDFFHPCSDEIEGFAGVPENAFGFQHSVTGEAYSGLVTYTFNDPEIREYMAAPLTAPLNIDQEYYIMFFASWYDGGLEIESLCATNHLGLRFFQDPDYSQDNPFEADNFAHLDYTEILSDSVNWTLVDGWFTADQPYNWVALGNFFDGANTTIEILNEEDRCYGIYYIENVCVATDPSFCQELLSTVQNKALKNSIEIYPNPASRFVTIESEYVDISAVEVVSQLGQTVLRQEFSLSKKINLSISNLDKGLYVIKVYGDKIDFFTSKLLIQ